MDAATSTLDAPPERRSFGAGLRDVVVCSLVVSAAAALVAVPIAFALDTRWSLVFVILRWLLVAALLITPAVQQIATRSFGATWQLPWALRTPATALLLTCESILFDIISAQFS